MTQIFGNTIFQIFFAITIAIFLTPYFNYQTKQLFLTVSIFLRTLLVLPFLIASSIASALGNIPKGAKLFVIILFSCICLSNFLNVILGCVIGTIIIPAQTTYQVNQVLDNLTPFWTLNLQPIISNDFALISGFIIGFILNIFGFPIIKFTVNNVNKFCMMFLNKFFVPLIPLFIFGYVVKLVDEKLFNTLLEQNLEVMIKMICFVITYLVFHVLLVSQFNLKKVIEIVKSLVSPMVAAFSTMSSASALPFNLTAVNKNVGDKNYANFICPTIMNIHMLGDTICIPIIAILLMNFYDIPISNQQFLIFAIYFTLTKFSGAGVPGGTILVMLPVLEKTLGFTSEMCSLITSIYIVIDCVTSSVNVAGNNIFAIYIYPMYKKLLKI